MNRTECDKKFLQDLSQQLTKIGTRSWNKVLEYKILNLKHVTKVKDKIGRHKLEDEF